MSKKLYIKTYGCQMNVYDSARMADVMAPHGYALSHTPEDADLVILNTCHIREKAEEKVYSDLGRLRAQKANSGGKMLVAVGGCVGQAEGEEIQRRAPYVDMVFGPQTYHRLPDMVERAANGNRKVVELDFTAVEKFDALPEQGIAQGKAAYLAVQEGCDKFCTFCVVPYTRGAEFSRSAMEIEAEARRMVDQGVMEITLLGQNVNAFHGKGKNGQDCTLADLIALLSNINGLERIRYMTSHPRDMLDDLIVAHRDIPKLMPFLHLPIQSGSDAILAKMNRKHKAGFYLEIVEKLRAARPDIAISSDFIVGFPGETEADFEATLRLVETVGYAQAYSFIYSPRPGTPAATDAAQIAEDVKTERLKRLQETIARGAIAFNTSTIGKTMPVLLDREGRRDGQLQGKTPYMQSVHVESDYHYAGQIVPVTLTQALPNSMAGVIASTFTERYAIG